MYFEILGEGKSGMNTLVRTGSDLKLPRLKTYKESFTIYFKVYEFKSDGHA